MTTFTKQCATVSSLGDALQKALDGLKPQLGDLPNATLMQIANTVARGTPRPAAPANPAVIDAALADAPAPKPTRARAKSNGNGADPISKLPQPVRKVARAARESYQGKEFAMADIGVELKVGSRKLIPTFNSLEKKGFFKKVGRAKRNGQDVNVYRLDKPLVVAA